jgi:glycosyltransferase involved in cell wall biosynthesis
MKNWLGITWGISNRFGWGVYGLNLVLELIKRGEPIPVCFDRIAVETLTPETAATLEPIIRFQRENLDKMHRAGKVATVKDAMVLHALGNGMQWSLISQAVEGDLNVGMIFFEFTECPPEGLARLNRLNGTVAGSTWNADVLKAWGVSNVSTVFQGVATDLFRPRTRSGRFDGKFAVFSGGKLDFRKGQDIVLAAFRIFAQRHSDAVLVTAWHNLWPLTALAMQHSPHLSTLPKVDPLGQLDIATWAAEQGIPAGQFVDIGMLPNHEMPAVLAEVDLAVFPNRCEGGTNLVAMEAMACGVPCVLAANTGQLDLVDDARCYRLTRQDAVSLPGTGTEGWGESSVEELLEAMERAYANRAEARTKGQAGADFMREWSWSNQIGKLMDVLETHC